MAKIKSTLDLVMERTKDMNMTDQDRKRLHEKQNAEKARMWVQRYLGRRMDADELGEELERQAGTFPQIRSLVCTELVNHLEPSGRNTMVLSALGEIFGADLQTIRDLMQSHRKILKDKMPKYASEMISSLNKEGYSGSALVPNLKGSPSWQEYLSRSRRDLRSRIVAALTGN